MFFGVGTVGSVMLFTGLGLVLSLLLAMFVYIIVLAFPVRQEPTPVNTVLVYQTGSLLSTTTACTERHDLKFYKPIWRIHMPPGQINDDREINENCICAISEANGNAPLPKEYVLAMAECRLRRLIRSKLSEIHFEIRIELTVTPVVSGYVYPRIVFVAGISPNRGVPEGWVEYGNPIRNQILYDSTRR